LVPKNVGYGDRISTTKIAQNNYLLVLNRAKTPLLVQLNESPYITYLKKDLKINKRTVT
jgi:hypothetical protein